MKIVLAALAAILVLGGAGAGAYFYFHQPAEAAVDASAEVKKEPEHAKKGHGEGESEKSEYVTLDPLILPIIDKDGISQTVSIVISVEVSDKDKAEAVTDMVPRLKDAYIQEMYGVLNKQAALQGGVVQVGMIKERLNQITQRVMGEGVVNDVLLQVVQQRSM